ncbi:MAG: tripartite tricarboxylate transporter permease [Nanoarchaeota archaeon]|nr:tripartite tricarboxylate transporter permease [Nanoarchaeota archaeon]
MLEEIIALFLGLLAGTLTGLFPGIHVNLVSVFLLSASPLLLTIASPISLAIFIVSMSITHSFLDFIPSIFLGAPDEDTFLSILPGHQLLKEGKGYEAVILSFYGSLTALVLLIIFIPLFIVFLPLVNPYIIPLIPFLLIFISLFIIFRDKNLLLSLMIFLLAGSLGFLTLNLPIKEPLLPLLTGLFGTSALLLSLKNKSEKIPYQFIPKLKEIKIPKNQFIKSILLAGISAPFCSFFPGVGSAHAATIASEMSKQDSKSFLFLIGLINFLVTSLSFVTIYSINKARSGTAVAVKEILKSISSSDLIYIIVAIFVSSCLSFILGVYITKNITLLFNKINYKYLTVITIVTLLIVNILFSSPLGLIVLLSSTALGIFTILSESRRINLMGCLLIPTIIFYLLGN